MATKVTLCKCEDGPNDPDHAGMCMDCRRPTDLAPGEIEDDGRAQPGKVYRGIREKRGGDTAEPAVVMVEVGDDIRPLRMTRLAAQKSPTGFNWGYGGSGPAALAHSILADALGDEGEAERLYQQYKADVIARLPQGDDWTISMVEVIGWVEACGSADE